MRSAVTSGLSPGLQPAWLLLLGFLSPSCFLTRGGPILRSLATCLRRLLSQRPALPGEAKRVILSELICLSCSPSPPAGDGV